MWLQSSIQREELFFYPFVKACSCMQVYKLMYMNWLNRLTSIAAFDRYAGTGAGPQRRPYVPRLTPTPVFLSNWALFVSLYSPCVSIHLYELPACSYTLVQTDKQMAFHTVWGSGPMCVIPKHATNFFSFLI